MIEEFRSDMAWFGIVTKDRLIADGKPHYIHVEGDKQRRKTGWYVLFPEGMGSFGSFKTGVKEKWRHQSNNGCLYADRTKHKQQMEAAARVREAEDQAIKKAARTKAATMWQAAVPATNHPYLTRKGVKSCPLW